MSGTYYDWTPVFDAINGNVKRYSDQNQYQHMLDQMMGPGTPMPQLALLPKQSMQTPSMQTAGGATIGGNARPVDLGQLDATPPPINGSYGQGAPMTYSGPAGQGMGASASSLLPMLRNAPSSMGFPLLLQSVMKNADRQQKIADARITPLSDDEARQTLGGAYRPGSQYGRDISGNVVTTQASDQASPGKMQQDLQAKIDAATKVPATAYQTQALGIEQQNADTQRSALNKPVSLGFGQQLVDPRSGRVIAGGGNPFGGEPIKIDPNSQSLNAQTGLSQAAINYLQNGTLPRGQAGQAAVQREVQDWSIKNGVNTATLKAQATATNHVLQQNMTRNNQSQILERELEGTIKSVAPIADAIGQGQINVGNLANVWTGKQVNDPQVQMYRDQLLRLRSELAGYNAVAAGKMTDQGTPRVDDGDLREAEQVISSGINSGGLQGLLNSVGMTTTKNRNILANSVDDANQQMWGLFNVGKNYKRTAPPLNLNNPGAGAGAGGRGSRGNGGNQQPTPQEIVDELRRRGKVK